MFLKSLVAIAQFSGAYIASPATIGSLVPSGQSLGRRMASQVSLPADGYVVELGAGTGSITAALLKHGVSPHQLISVECAPAMVTHLKGRYPSIKVLNGSAARLDTLLSEHIDADRGCRRVSHIVSSLPLRSLPKTEVQNIVQEVQKVLDSNGKYVQFTYDLRPGADQALADLHYLGSSVVWMNIPPARVKVYTLKKAATAKDVPSNL